MFMVILVLFDLILFGLLMGFFFESLKEKEPRAPKVLAALILLLIVLVPMILWLPQTRGIITLIFSTLFACGLVFLIPAKIDKGITAGTRGQIMGTVSRVDERDIVFARVRLQPDNLPYYRTYYGAHPEIEDVDSKRRQKGLLGVVGRIDNSYKPNAAMVHAAFDMPNFLGPQAKSEPTGAVMSPQLDQVKAADVVKAYARHIGADMVGICKVDPLWVYSHKGEIHYRNWEEWGREIEDLPPYAVVMLTEMNWDHVSAAPHTPTLAESANDYGKGAYLSTVLGRWFAHMGYQGIAQHSRNYDTLLVPLAVDAGLGEMGRHGYLIAPKFGARVRIFATLTDMPLQVDRPISIGVDEFCEKCKKCAASCPSKSIPLGTKTISNGIKRWKLNAETCFEYWAKVGTDCSICMAVCPFSRPDTFSHKLVRRLVSRSWAARRFFPTVDTILYGFRWNPRQVPDWLDYPK